MTQIIGLTGGIASGKSTVSAYLRERGHAVSDADQLVHRLQARGGRLYETLVAFLGNAILTETGELDRPHLAQLIFANPEVQEQSAQLQDQIIREELAREVERLKADHDLVFLDIPLLFEKGYEGWCDEVWLVVVDEQTQISRLMARNHLSREEAQQRVSSQMPLIDKIELAHHLIDNKGQVVATYAQVDRLLDGLTRGKESSSSAISPKRR